MPLSSLVLLLWFRPGGARRNIRIADSHHGTQQQHNALANDLELSAESGETLIPSGVHTRLSHRADLRAGISNKAMEQRNADLPKFTPNKRPSKNVGMLGVSGREAVRAEKLRNAAPMIADAVDVKLGSDSGQLADAFRPILFRVRALLVTRAILSGRRGCERARMSSTPPRRESSETAGDDGESGRQGRNVRNDEWDETMDLTPLGPLASKVLSVLADVFVVEDRDFVREDSLSLPPSSGAKAAGSSKQPFSWGDGAEGDEALRLPTGVAAAERLGKESLKGEALRGKSKLSAPLRDDQIKDAKKDPFAVVAVAIIIVFQATGSLIGLTREFLPDNLQGAAVVDELSQRRDAVDEASSDVTTGLE